MATQYVRRSTHFCWHSRTLFLPSFFLKPRGILPSSSKQYPLPRSKSSVPSTQTPPPLDFAVVVLGLAVVVAGLAVVVVVVVVVVEARPFVVVP